MNFEAEENSNANVSIPPRRNSRRDGIDYDKPAPTITDVFGSDSNDQDYSSDSTEDEYSTLEPKRAKKNMPEKSKKQKPRGHAAYRYAQRGSIVDPAKRV